MNKDLYDLSYSAKKDFDRKVFRIFFTIAFIFIILNVILYLVAFPLKQKSSSMEPSLPSSSCIMFSPLKNPSRGDVVVLNPLANKETSLFRRFLDCFVVFFTGRQFSINDDFSLMGEQNLIRRVVAVPGDTIYMRDHVLYIKPKGEKHFLTEFELIKNSYDINIVASPVGWENDIGTSNSFDEFVLQDKQYFVLGDKRNSCVDSRFFGTVTLKDIRATALFMFYPFSRFKLF